MIWDGYNNTDKVASSTICVATIEKGLLKWANLGDSGLRIIREKKFAVKTKEQQHSFNWPYQLGNSSSDTPNSCDCGQYRLRKGDIIIIATDGLFDNLDDEEIISLTNFDHSEKQIANNLFKKTLENIENKDKVCPFVRKAIAAGQQQYEQHKGGKPDDISILVAVVR